MGRVSEFEAVLRGQIAHAERGLEQAQRAGLDHEAHLHGARLLDLLDRATGHGVDAPAWVRPEVLAAARENHA